MPLTIKKNNEVDDILLARIHEFDLKLFPQDGEYSFPNDYLKKLYANHKEGMFVALDGENIAGYVNAIFLTDKDKEKYIQDRNYLEMKNNGLNYGENNMYFYTLAISLEYQDTSVIKELMSSFAKWLKSEQENGKYLKSVICEVITESGLKSAKIMGFLPFDIDSKGLGLYYSSDSLNSYIDNMIKWNNTK